MPPDISTGPMALAAGTSLGRISGPTATGPPGSDPLAALFAAFLANSGGSTPTPNAASSLLKTALKPSTSGKTNIGKTADAAKEKTSEKIGEKTGDNTGSAALPTLPPLLISIQMKPILPPTAGVLVGQETTEKKTMDTSLVPASPIKEKANAKPGGELPLQEAQSTASGASALSPVFLSASALIVTPISTVSEPSIISAAASAMGDSLTALPVVQGPDMTATSQPIAKIDPTNETDPTLKMDLPRPVSASAPAVIGAAIGLAQPLAGTALLSGPAGSEAASADILDAAFAQSVPADPGTKPSIVTPPSFVVPMDAALMPTKPLAAEMAATAVGVTDATATDATATDATGVTVPLTARVSLGGVRQELSTESRLLTSALPQTVLTVASQRGIPEEDQHGPLLGDTLKAPMAVQTLSSAPLLAAAAGETTMDELIATDGKATSDGGKATEGAVTTDGRSAMDGRMATDGKLLTAPGTPEKSLKLEGVSADTITRSRTVPARTLLTDLDLQVTGKRTERSIGSDAPLVLPNTVPAQAGTVSAETKPLSAADRAEMIRQVADGVGAMPLPAKADTSQQMTLQLHPKDWGQLQISVKIVPGTDPSAAQVITAHIVAETPQVKAALDNHSGDLRQALREAGLHLDKISVTVQSMDASAQAGTATSGGRHEANHGGASQGRGGAFGETTPSQQTGMSEGTGKSSGTGMSDTSGNGMPSFAASGGSHGGRHGGQPPPAYAAAYASAEPEDMSSPDMTLRTITSQIDTRA